MLCLSVNVVKEVYAYLAWPFFTISSRYNISPKNAMSLSESVPPLFNNVTSCVSMQIFATIPEIILIIKNQIILWIQFFATVYSIYHPQCRCSELNFLQKHAVFSNLQMSRSKLMVTVAVENAIDDFWLDVPSRDAAVDWKDVREG